MRAIADRLLKKVPHANLARGAQASWISTPAGPARSAEAPDLQGTRGVAPPARPFWGSAASRADPPGRRLRGRARPSSNPRPGRWAQGPPLLKKVDRATRGPEFRCRVGAGGCAGKPQGAALCAARPAPRQDVATGSVDPEPSARGAGRSPPGRTLEGGPGFLGRGPGRVAPFGPTRGPGSGNLGPTL